MDMTHNRVPHVESLISKFDISEVTSYCAMPYGDGHINDTYRVHSQSRYILQRINHHVFRSPEQVMENIVAVTKHLKEKIVADGGDPLRETLTVVPTVDGKVFYQDTDGNYYRMYLFIENATTYNRVEDPKHFYHAAKAFGLFQRRLADFPANQLHETIANFHHTGKRFEALQQAVKADAVGRCEKARPEIEFALARQHDVMVIVNAIESGKIPLRVTHNDTKLNNIMLDDSNGTGICVIDLDTVMPGSALYDYGDAIRFGASTAAEDEQDLTRVSLSLPLFEAFTKGYLEELKDVLVPAELDLLAFSAKLMTFEVGIRFLTDYLSGDTYFKTSRPEHNLERARTQLKLVFDMERKMKAMQQIIQNCL